MTDIEDDLRAAFAPTNYDVGGVAVNRQQVRVTILQEGVDPEALRAVVEEAVGADTNMTFHVRNETIEADDTVGTVLTIRRRR
jgi:hypothetical protein